MCLFNWWCVWWLVYLLTNLWAAKLRHLFSSQDVTERDNLHADVMKNISPNDLANLDVSPDSVLEYIRHLKHGKSDGTFLSSDFLIYAAPVIADALAQLFTAILRHGYVPASLWDYLIVPIPKGQKDRNYKAVSKWSGNIIPSVSNNYCSIALATSLIKTVEWVILSQFSECFCTNELQFGFKKGMSTSLCTGFEQWVICIRLLSGLEQSIRSCWSQSTL